MQVLKGSFHSVSQNESIFIDQEIEEINDVDFSVIHTSNKFKLITEYFKLLKNNKTPLLTNPTLQIEDIEKIKEKHSHKKYLLGHITCSSGTTSQNLSVKTFSFNLEQITKNAISHYHSLDIQSSMKILFPLPFYHSFGAVVGLIGTCIFNHELFYFEQTPTNEELVETITTKEIDLLYLTPSLLRILNKYLKRKKILINRTIKISIGAAHLYKSDLTELYTSFPQLNLYYTYGLSEAGPRVSTYKLPQKIDQIFDHNDLLPIGEVIDEKIKLIVKDDQLFITSPYSYAEKEIPTNDEVYTDENGKIYILGRSDFMINSGGINIYPEEIEAKLGQKLKERNFVICGLNSKLYGEVPVLVIEGQKDDEIDLEQINNELNDHLKLTRIIYLDRFPQTSMGKVLRKQLKNLINLA